MKPYHCYQLAPNEARSNATSKPSFTPTSKAISTVTSLLLAKPENQKVKNGHVSAGRPSMSDLWKQSQIQSFLPTYSESKFSATMLPVKSYPLLPACSQQCLIHCYQRSHIHCDQYASRDASFTPTSKAETIATRLLPAKPDPQPLAISW